MTRRRETQEGQKERVNMGSHRVPISRVFAPYALVTVLVLFSLVFCGVTPAFAYWPPLRDVQAWIEYSGDMSWVCFKLYNPQTGNWHESSGNWKDWVGDISVQDGVVAWREEIVGGTPTHPEWTQSVHFATYDPATQSWKKGSGSGRDWAGDILNQDGVVAWREEIVGGTPTHPEFTWSVHFATYDPATQSWKDGSSSGYVTITSITNATVYYNKDGSNYTRGYDHNTGNWYSGPTKTLSYFHASPASGNPPLWVWFTDMSIGATSWSWNFGDGGGSGERSTWHTYNRYGLFTVTQSVSGPAGSHSASTTIQTDFQGPTGSITINSDATHTNSTSVTLNLSATDDSGAVSSMRFSNDGTTWSGWQNYATSRAWTLTSGDGAKTVYVQYIDQAENESSTYNDSITLDTTVPTGTISVNNGASTTTSRSVTLNLSASDGSGSGMGKMRFMNESGSWSSWESFSTSKSWTLSSGDGLKIVYVQYIDQAGNESVPYSDSIILDTTAPTGAISINNGASTTTSRSVTLSLSASDGSGSGVYQMRFKNESDSWSSWESFSTSKSWTLSSGDGTKTVYVQYIDQAGNESSTYNDSITLDTTEPCPNPPTTPYNPSPPDDATDISTNANLSWSGGHPCPGESVTYDVYFDTSDPPTTLICDDVSSTTCDPGTLSYETHHYWQVVSNGLNGPSDGPVWDFTTEEEPCTDPPTTPYNPSPADDATDISINADLSWSGGHPCPGESVTYDVYFDTSNPPTTLICDDVSSTTCDPGTLSYDTPYYWQVVANGLNGPSTGPVWDFTTEEEPCTDPPTTPYNPSPADDATDISINTDLSWSGGHPCPGESVTYDVYFGVSDPPTTLICDDVSNTTCDPGTLNSGTQYYWKVVANGLNGPSPGPVWDFSAGACYDFDGDGDVDVKDISLVASRWRTSCNNPDPDNNSNTPNYEPRYDVNEDCIINIVDIMLVVVHWGETCG